jgi:hypothetical protein
MPSPARRLPALVVSTLALLVALALAESAVAAPTCQTGRHVLFEYTGAAQCYIVPAGEGTLRASATGGHGSGSTVNRHLGYIAPGGAAARVAGDLPVTPGQTLWVLVGGSPDGVAGGFNGGGAGGADMYYVCHPGYCNGYPTGGGGGGGASDVRTIDPANPLTLGSRLLVAAGGGGAGGMFDNLSVGGAAGSPGGSVGGAAPGSAGTANAGGVGGGSGTAGSEGVGGAGSIYGGGGGGGGLYGGGGGGNAGEWGSAGGGGGSNLVPDGGSATLADVWEQPAVELTFRGEPAQVSVALGPPSIVANGTSTTTATATVTDANGYPVPGEAVTFSSTGAQQIGPVSDRGDGTYTATITSTSTAGTATITAALGDLSHTATLTQRAGPATTVALALRDLAIEADGASTTVATATVADAHGNPVAGDALQFESDGGQQIGAVADGGDGTYTATITSTTTVGRSLVRATDTSVGARPSGSAPLAQTRPCVGGSLRRFEAVGDEQCYRVAAGVTRLRLMAVGAPGGGGARGARAVRDLDVTPGEILRVRVGGTPAGRSGGYNGGGDGGDRAIVDTHTPLGRGGGGASDVRTCSGFVCELADEDSRVLVAAGGGGDGGSGGTGGAAGEPGVRNAVFGAAWPGGAGGAGAGGPGGARGTEYFSDTSDGEAGALGRGGNGGRGNGRVCGAGAGGGGGGGLYGGGGGGGSSCGESAGGGGGSSHAPGGTVERAATATPTVVVSEQGAAAQLTLALAGDELVANGRSTTTATVTVRDAGGAPVVGETIALSATGGASAGPVADHGDGTYTATITASRTAGPVTVTAQDGALSDVAALTQVPGPAARVAVALDPASVVADGTSTTEATVTVEDADGNAIAGDALELETDGGQQVGPVSDNGDVTYSATVTATTSAGRSTITAVDRSVTPAVSGTAMLTQRPGAPAQIGLALEPAAVVADGEDRTTATATVTDVHGNAVPEQTVAFAASGEQVVGPVTDRGDGTYAAQVTASTVAGEATVTATVGTLSDAAPLTQRPGPAAEISVALDPAEIVADGEAATIATATVRDAHGNAVAGDELAFAASGEQVVGPVTDHDDGTYSATVTATTSAGEATITATDRSATPEVSGQATLRQRPGPAAMVELALDPAELVADGAATTTATAIVRDAHGNRQRAGGDDVVFASSGDPRVGPVTDRGDGSYTATVTAGERAGEHEITVTDRSIDPAATATATLTQRPGPAAKVAVALDPASIIADGHATTVATVTVRDAHGNAAGGEQVGLSASGGQPIGPVEERGDGVYTATLTATRAAGTATVTAVAGEASGSAELTQTAPPVQPPPGREPPAEGRLSVAGVKTAADGTMTIRAAVPAAGRIEARASLRRSRRAPAIVVGRAQARAAAAGTVRMVVRPTARGRRLLRARGERARLAVAISFARDDGAAQTARLGPVRLRSRMARPHARFAIEAVGAGADGGVRVRLRVPGPGRVELRASARVAGRTVAVAAARVRAARAGVMRIVARPTARAALVRGALGPLRIAVAYTAPGEAPRRLVLAGVAAAG